MIRKNFNISEQNEEKIRNLQKVTQIEKGKPVSQSQIINTALTYFFTAKQDFEETNYTQLVEVLRCYNII